jgi:hypothetical protein
MSGLKRRPLSEATTNLRSNGANLGGKGKKLCGSERGDMQFSPLRPGTPELRSR